MSFRENFSHPLGKLRVIGAAEGLSFLALLGVAMPLKYWMGLPVFVRVFGPIHGLLFIWLCVEIAQAVFGKGWPLKHGALVFAAAFFPCGPFLIDRWLKKQQGEFPIVAQ